jgi:hypothetical protein
VADRNEGDGRLWPAVDDEPSVDDEPREIKEEDTMSDMSQGPGWWIASDGKWYAPHLHPSVRVPEPWETAGDAHTESVADAHTESAGSVDPVAHGHESHTPAGDIGAHGVPGPGPVGLDPSWTPETSGYQPGPDPGRKRSRTPLAAAISILVVILVVVGIVVVFGDSTSASAKVVDAVNSTLSDGTAHVTMNLSGSADGTDVTGTGSGSIDFTNNALQLQMNVAADGQQVPISAIYLGGVVYETIPGLSTVVPGKSWLSIDLSALQKAEAQNPSTGGLGNNPTVMLQMLAQQGNTVVALGPSTVGGVAVNGYAVTVNPSTVAQELKNANLPSWMQQTVAGLKVHDINMKVYVDNAGLLRSFEIQLTESDATAGPVTVDETLNLSDYGTPVNVTAPPADQVESFQQLLQVAGTQGTTATS